MYIDTSCLVAFYMPEELSPKVHKKITTADSIAVSSVTVVEFLSALNKKVRMKLSSEEETGIAYEKINQHITKGFYRYVEIDEHHFKRATELLLQANSALRALDAIHLSIVIEEKIKIYSNDAALLKAAKELNIKTIEV